MNRSPETKIAGQPPRRISDTKPSAVAVKLFAVAIPESKAPSES